MSDIRGTFAPRCKRQTLTDVKIECPSCRGLRAELHRRDEKIAALKAEVAKLRKRERFLTTQIVSHGHDNERLRFKIDELSNANGED